MANWYDTLVDNVDSITASMWNTMTNWNRKRPISLTAYTAIVPETAGATITQTEMGTNVFPVPYAAFQPGTDRGYERLNWITHLHPDFGYTDFTAQIFTCYSTETALDSEFKLSAMRFDYKTAMTSTLPLVTTFLQNNDGTEPAWSVCQKTVTAFTVTNAVGKTTNGNNILWELKRSSEATDTYTSNSNFLAINLYPV